LLTVGDPTHACFQFKIIRHRGQAADQREKVKGQRSKAKRQEELTIDDPPTL